MDLYTAVFKASLINDIRRKIRHDTEEDSVATVESAPYNDIIQLNCDQFNIWKTVPNTKVQSIAAMVNHWDSTRFEIYKAAMKECLYNLRDTESRLNLYKLATALYEEWTETDETERIDNSLIVAKDAIDIIAQSEDASIDAIDLYARILHSRKDYNASVQQYKLRYELCKITTTDGNSHHFNGNDLRLIADEILEINKDASLQLLAIAEAHMDAALVDDEFEADSEFYRDFADILLLLERDSDAISRFEKAFEMAVIENDIYSQLSIIEHLFEHGNEETAMQLGGKLGVFTAVDHYKSYAGMLRIAGQFGAAADQFKLGYEMAMKGGAMDEIICELRSSYALCLYDYSQQLKERSHRLLQTAETEMNAVFAFECKSDDYNRSADHSVMGFILESLDHNKEALNHFRKAFQLSPDTAYNLIDHLFNKMDDLDAATQYIDKLDILNCTELNENHLCDYGWILFHAHRFEDAQKYFEKSIEIDATGVNTVYQSAFFYYEMQQWKKALSMLEESVSSDDLDRYDWRHYWLLGRIHLDMGDIGLTLSHLNKAIELAESNADNVACVTICCDLVQCLVVNQSLDEINEIVANVEGMIRMDNIWRLHLMRAIHYSALNRNKDATSAYKASLNAINSQSIPSYNKKNWSAQVYLRVANHLQYQCKELQRAEQFYRRIVDSYGAQCAIAYYHLSNVYKSMYETLGADRIDYVDLSLKNLEKAKELNPTLPQIVESFDAMHARLIAVKAQTSSPFAALATIDENKDDNIQPSIDTKQTEESQSKPIQQTLMEMFLTEMCNAQQYIAKFVETGLCDITVISDMDEEILINDLKISKAHSKVIIKYMDTLIANAGLFRIFMNECTDPPMSDLWTILDKKGILEWDCLSYIAKDDNDIARLFEVESSHKAVQFMAKQLAQYRDTGIAPLQPPMKESAHKLVDGNEENSNAAVYVPDTTQSVDV